MKLKFLGPGPKLLGLMPLGWYLKTQLSKVEQRGEFYAAVALTDLEGLQLLSSHIRSLLRNNSRAKAIVGIDLGLTSSTMDRLIQIFGNGNVFVYHNPKDTTFHPKIYIIKVNRSIGIVIVGSSNLTGAGFLKNLEINVAIELDLRNANDQHSFDEFHQFFDKLLDQRSTRLLDRNLLLTLAAKSSLQSKTASMTKGNKLVKLSDLFKGEVHGWDRTEFYGKSAFLMTLSYNDVSGMRGDKYVRIPKRARDTNPRFWGWDSLFRPSPRAGHMERFILADYQGIQRSCRLYYVERVKEFRLVLPEVYGLGRNFAQSIFKISKIRRRYYIEIIPRTDPLYERYLTWCTEMSPKGTARVPKVWGFV